MPTKNIEVGADWVQIAEAADDALMVSAQSRALVMFATGTDLDDEEDPESVAGHVVATGLDHPPFFPRAGMTGDLFARSLTGPLSLVVDGSSVGDDEGGD